MTAEWIECKPLLSDLEVEISLYTIFHGSCWPRFILYAKVYMPLVATRNFQAIAMFGQESLPDYTAGGVQGLDRRSLSSADDACNSFIVQMGHNVAGCRVWLLVDELSLTKYATSPSV